MDTLRFGYYTTIGGNYYAVQGETWTWDHNAPDRFEGWKAVDQTAPQNDRCYVRRITPAIWSGHGNTCVAPILGGQGSVWFGAYEDTADSLCWELGLGYGNLWCQKLQSRDLHYTGAGDVTLSFRYFNDCELNYDYSKVYVWVPPSDPYLLNGAGGFTARIGASTDPATPPPGVGYTRTVTANELGNPPAGAVIRFVLNFKSDGGLSDQDGGGDTVFGPFGVDDISIGGAVSDGGISDFENDLGGWQAFACPGIGSWFSIQPLTHYTILDPCACALSGNVAAFHDMNGLHPSGQYVSAFSPAVRKSIEAPAPAWNAILTEWNMYVELPDANGVGYRPVYNYYPYVCPQTGLTGWSGPQGQPSFHFVGEQPVCYRTRSVGTDWGIPPDVQMVQFVFEIYSSCSAFNIRPCSGVTNFTPVIDNVQLRFTGVAQAPVVTWGGGAQYQDNFAAGNVLDATAVGNADITYDLHNGISQDPNYYPYLGDSLVASGPAPTASSRYLTKLWFRVRREGPAQYYNARYANWRARVADFGNIVGETSPRGRNFAFGWMDSCENGTRVSDFKFCSQWHESDAHHTTPEQGEDNEIIWDRMLTPGTSIEYFVTAAYTCTPGSNFYLPDTSGGNYMEFEILPSYRNVFPGPTVPHDLYKFPAVLYVDAANPALGNTQSKVHGGSEWYVEHALNMNDVLGSATSLRAAIPNPAPWDRYDYLDAASNWCAPMFRLGSGNGGGAANQFLGYRFIMVNTSSFPQGTMRTADWSGLANWLTNSECSANAQVQGLWLAGDDIAKIIADPNSGELASFLPTFMGANYECDAYDDPTGPGMSSCPPGEDPAKNDTSYCANLRPMNGSGWTPDSPLEILGNWCPPQLAYDVLTPTGGHSAASKRYQRISDGWTSDAAEVVNDMSSGSNNFRTVLHGYGMTHMIVPDLSQPIPGQCLPDSNRIIQAVEGEAKHAMAWTLGLAVADLASLKALTEDPCLNPNLPNSGVPPVDGGRVNRLYQNAPNPFNPRTTIYFSLATNGPAKLIIYDVSGRKVKTLVDESLKAGMHQAVWDGTDEVGHPVALGVYWSQLRAGSYNSNKKMVVL